jgi:hypothetical protein
MICSTKTVLKMICTYDLLYQNSTQNDLLIMIRFHE